jgi:hypothetical protein
MSTATDAELVVLGERFEKLLLEYLGSWLDWGAADAGRTCTEVGDNTARLRADRPRSHRAAEQRDEFAASCMTGKEHCEGRRGLGHDRTPVAAGSPQAFRTLIRE